MQPDDSNHQYVSGTDWIFMSTQKSYVDNPRHDGPLRNDKVMRMEPHEWDSCLYQRDPQRAPFPLSAM